MFAAYVKNISQGTSQENIFFNTKKAKYINNIILLNPSSKGNNWYTLNDAHLLFHSSWLNCITNIDQNNVYLCCMGNYNTIIQKINYKYIDCLSQCVIPEINEIHLFRDLIDSNINFVGGPTSNNFSVCSQCGRLVISYCYMDDVCTTCFNKHVVQCAFCQKNFFNKTQEVNFFDNGASCYLCDECKESLQQCQACKKYIVTSSYNFNGECFCSECIKEKNISCVQCYKCRINFASNSKHIKKTKLGYLCDICRMDRRLKLISGGIQQYSYKPLPIFFQNYEDNDYNNLYFGVELEVVTPYTRENKYDDKIAKWLQYEVNSEEDLCYIKYDSSIGKQGMNGFEIVTHPFSWKWLISDIGINTINKIMEIKNFNCSAFRTNTCGMHVHLSKDAFIDTIHLYDFLKLIYENKEFSVLISERTNNLKIDMYSNFEKSLLHLKDMAQLKRNIDSDRHKAVNLNSPNTVEVRIFRSTLDYLRFMKNIEFCKSVFDFTEKKEKVPVTLENFKKYIVKYQTQYSNLYNFMKDKNLICV